MTMSARKPAYVHMFWSTNLPWMNAWKNPMITAMTMSASPKVERLDGRGRGDWSIERGGESTSMLQENLRAAISHASFVFLDKCFRQVGFIFDADARQRERIIFLRCDAVVRRHR